MLILVKWTVKARRIYYDNHLLQISFDVAEKCFNIPVRVVALHSWVWLVFATETELLQREILGKVFYW